MAETCTVFEVGPRDGLQNEPARVSFKDKLQFISELAACGINEIEVGAFVREDRVQQMAETDLIYDAIHERTIRLGTTEAWSLVPNRKGLQRALLAGAKNLAVFTAATDSFTQKNIGMSIRESLAEFREVIREAKQQDPNIRFRGYVSTAFGCPFEGKVAPPKSLRVVEALLRMGVEQVSIGDTIGVATPDQMDQIMKPALKSFGVKKIAGHFHDTRGTALANVLRSLEIGIRTFDSSAGGLGGCPFAPGASGNLATEDLLYLLHGLRFKTGINLAKLCQTSLWLAKRLKHSLPSRYLAAYASDCR